jgi:hypothetical protein
MYDGEWRKRLSGALKAVEPEAKRVAEMLCENAEVELDDVWRSPETLLEEVDELKTRPDSWQAGLAHSLAELGKLRCMVCPHGRETFTDSSVQR